MGSVPAAEAGAATLQRWHRGTAPTSFMQVIYLTEGVTSWLRDACRFDMGGSWQFSSAERDKERLLQERLPK